MKKTPKIPFVFFNASVILAGLSSPQGGSAKLLNFVRENRIKGFISDIILDEVERRAEKIGKTKEYAQRETLKIFKLILPPPGIKTVEIYSKIVNDPGDSHILASTYEAKTNYLVSLDKKHILSLKNKIKEFNICSPKELIEFLAEKTPLLNSL